MSNAAHRPPVIAHIPPPLLFLAAFLAGIGLEALMPLGLHLRRFSPVMHPLGLALLDAGLVLAAASIGYFAWMRTTVLPHGRPGRLVTGGPYRFSRNPMYVSLTLTYLGAASLWQFPWSLILLPLPLLWLDRLLIPYEERRLAALFGRAYEDYRGRVRRWL